MSFPAVIYHSFHWTVMCSLADYFSCLPWVWEKSQWKWYNLFASWLRESECSSHRIMTELTQWTRNDWCIQSKNMIFKSWLMHRESKHRNDWRRVSLTHAPRLTLVLTTGYRVTVEEGSTKLDCLLGWSVPKQSWRRIPREDLKEGWEQKHRCII